jgi:GT2 family glycosyltransferase
MCRTVLIFYRKQHTECAVLLNNDVALHSLWLKSMVETFESYLGAGFAASKMLFYDNIGIIDRTVDGYNRAETSLLRGGMLAGLRLLLV